MFLILVHLANLPKFQFCQCVTPIILSGCSSRNMNMSYRTDSDCGEGKFCWSIMGGGKECQVKASYQSSYTPKSNQANEQTAKNTNQKEITTNIIQERDGIAYLPNESKRV